MSATYEISPELDETLKRWQQPAVLVGVMLFVVSIIGAFFNPDEFFRSYLFSYLFWIGLALGSLAILMTQYLTGGAWGVMTRRIFESASRTLPYLAIFFIPIGIGIPRLYRWSHPAIVQGDEILRHRAGYMNPGAFILRAIAYFLIWLALSYFLNKWSGEEDERGNQERRLAKLSAPGLILYVFTVTFSSVDWAESLADHWFSTMWGFLFVAGQGLIAMCFGILILALLSRRKPMSEAVRPIHFHDLGKLLLMFVMLWAYFQFSQLLIVWSGNLSNEIPWYMPRFASNWRALSIVLIYGQFFVPFLLLLSRRLKRNPWTLAGVALLLIVMRWIDLFWVVMPEFYKGLQVHWLNFTVPLGLGGMWIGAFIWQLKKRPLLPVGDPKLEGALLHGV